MALTKDRDTVFVDSPLNSDKVFTCKTADVFYKGALAMMRVTELGVISPGAASTGSIGAGVVQERLTATAGSTLTLKTGVAWFDNSSTTDEITAADVGKLCYIVDDQRVAKTSNSGARSIAGRVHSVNSGSAGQPGRGVAVLIDATLINSGSTW